MERMKNNSEVRVRFAPSPTGHLHIGGVRAAMFNWLFARNAGGKFLLRIEDTDLERSKQEYTDSILEALAWCGLDYDEPPVIQSERIESHKQVVRQLLEEGKAYCCYCTPEEIAERQKVRNGHSDLFSMYDGACWECNQSETGDEKQFVVRFKVPREKEKIIFEDLIRGTITFDVDQFDDFIIARSDGTPMYNLVVVLDDAHMSVSHVIRGEDHISNTPKQIMLYQACGLSVPQFAHLPLILGPSGDRLSKRDAATSVLDYRKNGFLPEALFNYLVRLGWSHGDQEIFSRQEMISHFSLNQVGKKGAIFDPVKLAWLNGVYIRETKDSELLERTVSDVEPALYKKLTGWTEEQILTLIGLYKDRVKTLDEMIGQLVLLHNGPQKFDIDAVQKWVKPETSQHLKKLIDLFGDIDQFSEKNLSEQIKVLCKLLGIKLVALAQPIRIALTGTSASPGIFALLSIVGKQTSLDRLNGLLEYLSTE